MPLQRIARMALAVASLLMLVAVPASAQVRVGSKNFTEQFIVAEIYAQALEAANIKVERKLNLGGTLIARRRWRRSRSTSTLNTRGRCCWWCSSSRS